MARSLLLTVLLCFLFVLPGQSHAQCPGITTALVPFAEEPLTVGTSVTTLSASAYEPVGTPASLAQVTLKSGNLSYALTQAPNATLSHDVVTSPQTFFLCGLASIQGFKAIRMTTDAVLFITYFRPKTP